MLSKHYLLFLVIFLEDYRFTVLQLQSLTKWNFIQISIIHDNISSQVADKGKVGYWPMDELIHHPWQYLSTYSQEVSSEKLP